MSPIRVVPALVAVLLSCSAAPAAAQEPLESPGSTDLIEYVESTTTPSGLTWDLYRNLAYPCSVSGYQTFAVGIPAGSLATEPRPLWVRMRGGGVGFFSPDGQPQPSAGNKSESDLAELIGFADGNALNQRINEQPAGFRNISVSMCNHDIYSGGDQPDPNNPNLTPDGQPRTTNGLFATKAAVGFVQDRYPTTRTFLHGTSAGSFGSWNVAWSLQLQDRPVAGFVADSGVVNNQYETDLNAKEATCARGAETLAAIRARTHPLLADPTNQPDLLISSGTLSTPVFNVYSRDDANSCGTEQVSCTMPDGSVQVMGSMQCKLDRVSKAIEGLPASSNSRTMELCVRAGSGAAGTCTRHVVTGVDNFPNTNPAFPADYNGVILEWALDRLDDPLPALDVELDTRSKLRFEQRRPRVRCLAGGYEKRTCTVKLIKRDRGKERVVARGTGTIPVDAGKGRVQLKLTDRGRRLVANGPRRGLKVRAAVRVIERYTDRIGVSKRRLRAL